MITKARMKIILERIKEIDAIGGSTPEGGWVMPADALEDERDDLFFELFQNLPEEEYDKIVESFRRS